ncbi:MAG TPA: SpoIIE family protein phosphatase [Acidimicrobiales bacterium]|nr:SpoIIE family protein phosphatase [Acidimicrobiales bacterium]
MESSVQRQRGDVEVDAVRRARAQAAAEATALGRADLADDVALVVSELVTNAELHGGGCAGVAVRPSGAGLRVEVRDHSFLPPIVGRPSEGSLTGRGLRLVGGVASSWGAEADEVGKTVWAIVTGGAPARTGEAAGGLGRWADDRPVDDGHTLFHVELGDVPTDLLLAAKSHVDNVVREFTLADTGASAGVTAEVPDHLRDLLVAVVERFSAARLSIKRQALAAANRGDIRTRLSLDLPASAAQAAEEYLRALDQVDAYCRARRLLTLESRPQHRLFRHWYIDELVTQLRAAAAGRPVPPSQTFEHRLLAEVDRAATVRRTADRMARLYAVTAALATAATPEAVASAVLTEGVAALGASAGGVLLATDAEHLSLSGAVGYADPVAAGLRTERRDAALPAAVALRTGEPVWLESPAERDERFPQLVGLEADTVALCAVPLEVESRRLGALRFSFNEARLFDDDERRFVLALAAQTAQALDRAQLQLARIDVGRRLQRSLLPPKPPAIAGLDVAAVYRSFGTGIAVGGDFYDIWPAGAGRWAIAVGDASGTGPEAAARTALVRHTLRALAITADDPGDILGVLNTALLDAEPEPFGERFCTILFGFVTVGDGAEVRLTGGGHPPVVVRRVGGSVESVLVGGSLLGLLPEIDVASSTIRLAPGDALVLVTDGVLEARHDGEQFDHPGLALALATAPDTARGLAGAVESAVLAHTGGELTDDMVVVALRVPGS